MLLAGAFFLVGAFPAWFQVIPKLLPLTYLNDAMPKVAFEGASLCYVWNDNDIAVPDVWGIALYIIATHLFKGE